MGQGNVFTGVCDSVQGGCLVPGGVPGPRGVPGPGGESPGPQPRGKLRGIWFRPITKGKVEGNWPAAPFDSYCRGRYASYWNAFLLRINFLKSETVISCHKKITICTKYKDIKISSQTTHKSVMNYYLVVKSCFTT